MEPKMPLYLDAADTCLVGQTSLQLGVGDFEFISRIAETVDSEG